MGAVENMGNLFKKPSVTPASQIVKEADKNNPDAAKPPEPTPMPDPDGAAAQAAASAKYAEISKAGSSSESTLLTENRLGDISKAFSRMGAIASQIVGKG